jgi:hypothetical protein
LARQTDDFKRTLEFFGTVDKDLRNLRIQSYSNLWRRTRALPRWPIDESFTYARLRGYAENLRDWYFGEGTEAPGGMLMTDDAALAYRTLQTKIATGLASAEPARTLDPGDYAAIRELCSALRTELTRDLLSRRETPGSAA